MIYKIEDYAPALSYFAYHADEKWVFSGHFEQNLLIEMEYHDWILPYHVHNNDVHKLTRRGYSVFELLRNGDLASVQALLLADMTAIEKACAFADAVMSVTSRRTGKPFQPRPMFDNSYDYCRQVAGVLMPEAWIPSICESMGVVSNSTARVYWRLVRDCDRETWLKAEAEGWALKKIMRVINGEGAK